MKKEELMNIAAQLAAQKSPAKPVRGEVPAASPEKILEVAQAFKVQPSEDFLRTGRPATDTDVGIMDVIMKASNSTPYGKELY